METIGVKNLTLSFESGIEGECTLCEIAINKYEEVYLFSNEDAYLIALHKPCFDHLGLVMARYIMKFEKTEVKPIVM